MRPTGWRRVAFGLFLLPLLGVGAVAQRPDEPHPAPAEPPGPKWQPAAAAQPGEPPPSLPRLPGTFPNKLKAEAAALAEERLLADDGTGAERARLYARLTAILDRLNAGPGPAPQPRPVEPIPPKAKFDLEGGKTVDSVRLAMNLFRDNDLDAALRAFRGMDLAQLTREDRAFVRYMTASCLRRLGKASDAAVIYREVADAQEDEFLAGCAVSQLALIRTSQELEAQIAQLRARAKTP
jgi:hypothetical protein